MKGKRLLERTVLLPHGVRGPWWRPAGIYLASRAGVLLVVAGVSYVKHTAVTTALLNWDGRWYLRVAEHGYAQSVPAGIGTRAQSDLGFFPLLPLLIRLVHVVTALSFPDSGLLVGGLAGLLGAELLWFLLYAGVGSTRRSDRRDTPGSPATGVTPAAPTAGAGPVPAPRDRNRVWIPVNAAAADRGTALVFFSPAAFVLSMVYGEPLLIAFGAGVFLCLQRHRWLLAGVLAGLMTATDPLGTAIVVPCVIAAWPAVRYGRNWRALAAPVLSLCGIGSFAVYLWVHTGSPLSYAVAQRRGWQYGKIGVGIPLALRDVVEHGFVDPNYWVKAVSSVLILIALILYLRFRPPLAQVGYVVAVLALAAVSSEVAWSPRVAIRAFPLLAWVGTRLRGFWFVLVFGLSALALAGLTVVSLGASSLPFTP